MSGYIGPLPVPQGIQNKETFTATAGQTTFNTNGYTDGAFISVYLNGVRLINGTDYTATNGSDIVLTSAASASDVLDFETFNSFSLASQQFENITTKNPTHEDTDGGRESAISFKGEQSGGEISTLAQIQASHDGTSDDQKGDLIFKTNDGSDNNAPTEAARIDSGQNFILGDTTTAVKFKVKGTGDLGQLVSTNTGAGGAQLELKHESTSPANGDSVGLINFGGFDAGSNNTQYASLVGKALDVSAEQGALDIGVRESSSTYTHTKIRVDKDGLKFNGDTSADNALNDYEEGTFQPTITCGGGTAAVDASEDLATYTKIGRMVMVQGRILVGTISSPSSALIVSGLPFTVGNAGEGALPGAVAGNLYDLGSSITGAINAEMHSQGILFRDSGATTGSVTNMADHLKTGTRIGFTATYIIV